MLLLVLEVVWYRIYMHVGYSYCLIVYCVYIIKEYCLSAKKIFFPKEKDGPYVLQWREHYCVSIYYGLHGPVALQGTLLL